MTQDYVFLCFFFNMLTFLENNIHENFIKMEFINEQFA